MKNYLLYLKYLFCFTVFATPLYLLRLNFFDLPTNALDFLMLLGIGSWLGYKLIFKNFLTPVSKNLWVGIFMLFLGLIISLTLNQNPLVGLGILKGWFILPLLFSFALLDLLTEEHFLEQIYTSLYFSTVAVSLIALGYKFLGLATYDNRLTAFYSSPNYLAVFLAPGIFLSMFFLFKSSKEKTALWKKLGHFFALFSLISVIYFTFSYETWLALLISLLILSALLLPKKYLLGTILFFSFLLLTLFVSQKNTSKLQSILNSSERSSLASRQMIWNSAFFMLQEKPLVGIGPGNFQQTYLALQPNFPPYLEWAVPQPHNIFLAFWLQAGLIGLLGFCLILYYLFTTALQLLRQKKDALFIAPVLAYLFFTILVGLVDTPYWKNDWALLFWVFASSLLYLKTPSSKN